MVLDRRLCRRPRKIRSGNMFRRVLYVHGASWVLMVLAIIGSCEGTSSWAGSLKAFFASGCEGDTFRIGCPANTTINITHAHYGFVEDCGGDKSECSASWLIERHVTRVVKETCNDQRRCPISVSRELFDIDPCPLLFENKGVTISYNCVPGSFQETWFCPGDPLHFHCPPSSLLVFKSVNLEHETRPRDEQCQHVYPFALNGATTTNSLHGDSKEDSNLCPPGSLVSDTLTGECQGKTNCLLKPSDVPLVTIWSQPCALPKITKALRTVHTCVPRRALNESASVFDLGKFPSTFQPPVEAESFEKEDTSPQALPTPQPTSNELHPRKPPFTPSDIVSGKYPVRESPMPSRRPRVQAAGPWLAEEEKVVTEAGRPVYFEAEPEERYTVDDFPVRSPEVSGSSATPCNDTHNGAGLGFLKLVAEWMGAYKYLTSNREKTILYILLSVFAGLLILSVILIVRLSLSRRRGKRRWRKTIAASPLTSANSTARRGRGHGGRHKPKYGHSGEEGDMMIPSSGSPPLVLGESQSTAETDSECLLHLTSSPSTGYNTMPATSSRSTGVSTNPTSSPRVVHTLRPTPS